MRIFAPVFFAQVFAVLVMALSLATSAVFADEASTDAVFTVPQVPVQASATSAAEAQRIARDQGRRQAMDILLRRLTAEEDWVYLPRLAIGEAAAAGLSSSSNQFDSFGDPSAAGGYVSYTGKSAVMIEGAMLPSLEEAFFVFNEKSSSTSYSAQITYRFKAEEVRALLKDAGIPYSESQSRKALVIPVLETDNGAYLWESNNPWARAWLARPLANELTPLVLPRGDQKDMDMLPARQATAFNQFRLQQLAERYGVSQVIIAHGVVSESDDQFLLRVRLRSGFLNTVARRANEYSVRNSNELYDNDDTAVGRVLVESFYRGRNDDFPVLAARAVESIVTKYAADWKAETLVDHSMTRLLVVNLWADSIEELSQIRAALDDTPLVERVESPAIAAGGGTLTLTIVGDVQQLKLEMRQRNIVLWRSTDGAWNIATPERAAIEQIARPEASGDFSFFADDGTRPVGEDGLPLPELPGNDLPDFAPMSERERGARDNDLLPGSQDWREPEDERPNDG